MTYTALAGCGVVVAVLLDLALLRTRLLGRRAYWVAYAIVLAFQLLVNGILTGRRVVRYDPDTILRVHLAYAPIEDLGFGFALVTCTLSLWVWLGRHGVGRCGTERVATRPERRISDDGRS